MDLDHFKYVNDTLGHPIGDLLLSETAARLQDIAIDEVDIVARLGGDEFALLLPGRDIAEARRFADAIQHALELPMTLQGHVVDVRGSIGIAVFPEHGTEGSTLLRRAMDEAAVRKAVNEVGALQTLWHYGGEFDRGAEGITVKGDEKALAEMRGLFDIGYQGYAGFELCHPLPVVNGQTVGLDFVNKNALLAAEYMRGIRAEAQKLHSARA